MSAKSTTARRSRKTAGQQKPAKPYEGFPLFPHASGRWAKQVRKPDGKQATHYFGRWGTKVGGEIVPVDDVEASARAAKLAFDRQWPFISEGRTVPSVNPVDDGACTIKSLCNEFWRSKRAKLLAGELSQRSFKDYELTTDLLVATFGKDRRVDDLRPDDFQRLRSSLAERLGVHALKNTINRCRVVFKFAHDNRLIKERVNYGQSFDRPSAKALRRAKKAAGARLFEAAELRTILNALDGKPVEVEGEDEPVTLTPDPVTKAMVLLGCNAGFGNTDCATLPQPAVDLESGWIDFPRPKTEIDRRVPLWPETVASLKAAIAARPAPAGREYADRCFLTRSGMPWVRVQQHRERPDQIVPLDPLGQRFTKLVRRLKINGRSGLGFYTLRHVFETIAGESRDQVAVNAIMGHVDASMAGQYRERISDARLHDVVNVVREWLFRPSDLN